MRAAAAREFEDLVERYGALVADPVERLKFVRLCAKMPPEGFRRLRRWRIRLQVWEALWRASRRAPGSLGWGGGLLLAAYRSRRRLPAAVVMCALTLPLAGTPGAQRPAIQPEAPRKVELPAAREGVWLVEVSGTAELYSNGLRVLNQYPAQTGPRHYPVFSAGGDVVALGSAPAGIVYHTTENDLLALEPGNRDELGRRERGLLAYVQGRKLYHFVIDRFGRVYRIVPETQYAHHAGHSVWADHGTLYLDLNQSFLGVAFEAQTAGGASGLTAAQIHSGGLLTARLRAAFGIADGACVSHDLVSVNPGRMLIGYHTDFGGDFPYGAMGLTNKYDGEIPSVTACGFAADAAFVEALRGRVWPGLWLSEARLERAAAERGVAVGRYRRDLQRQYRRRQAVARRPSG